MLDGEIIFLVASTLHSVDGVGVSYGRDSTSDRVRRAALRGVDRRMPSAVVAVGDIHACTIFETSRICEYTSYVYQNTRNSSKPVCQATLQPLISRHVEIMILWRSSWPRMLDAA